MGRAILRLWIEEQLRLVAAARERRSLSRWPRDSQQKSPDGQLKQRKSRHRRSGGGGAAGADPSSSHSPPSPPAK